MTTIKWVESSGATVFRFGDSRLAIVTGNLSSEYLIIAIGGLGDGPFDLPYIPHLEAKYTVLQPVLRSSYAGFGVATLDFDACDLRNLFWALRLRDDLNQKKTVMLGFSTGCQSILRYIETEQNTQTFHGIILQGAVSDRQCMTENWHDDLRELFGRDPDCHMHSKENMYTKRVFGCGIAYRRLADLLMSEGLDDFFSVDSKFCLDRMERVLKGQMTLFAFGLADEYIPSMEAYLKMLQLLKRRLPDVHECAFEGADHSMHGHESAFVERMAEFLARK